MRRVLGLILLFGALLPLPGRAWSAPQSHQQSLQRCIDAQFAARRRERWGIMIKDAVSGEVLYDRNASLTFNPASNVKLVTTAAALHQLGPRFRFRTEVYGRLERGRVRGGLYLRGGLDPTLETADLAQLAARLRQLGVREVEGPLYLDTSAYDGPTDPPGYRSFRSSHPFRAGVGALSLNHNVVRIMVSPAAERGGRAQVTLEPASDYFKLQALVRTSARGSRLRVATHSKGRWTGVSVTGRLHLRAKPRSFWRRVFQPHRYAGHTFLDLLERAGIAVRSRTLRESQVPVGMPLLAVHASPELTTIIRRGNKNSSNLVAEHLLLALGEQVFGPPASYPKGRRALEQYFRRHGVQPGRYLIENGSGLSRRSRLRPSDLVTILAGIQRDFSGGPEISASLPLAGADGTLRRRFSGTPVQGAMRAKTGTLAGIQCLSGFVGQGRQLLLFSFLTARIHRFIHARRLQIGMSRCMVRYLRSKEEL